MDMILLNGSVMERKRKRRSILKSPTTHFETTSDSDDTHHTKRLKFADNATVMPSSTTDRGSSVDSTGSSDSGKFSTPANNGKVMGQVDINKVDVEYEVGDDGKIEVAVTPDKNLRVSPEAWRAFVEVKRRYKDYPNEMEKTDYTYSRLSKYNKQEVIPGFPIPPNMSRKPIHPLTPVKYSFLDFSSSTSIDTVDSNTPSSTSFINRYEYNKGLRHRFRTSQSDFFSDSGEDEEYTVKSTKLDEQESLLSRASSVIASSFNKFLSLLVFISNYIVDNVRYLFSKYVLRRDPLTPYHYQPPPRRLYASMSPSSFYYKATQSTSSVFILVREWFSKVVHTLSSYIHQSRKYVSTRYTSSSRRQRIAFILLPLLLLAGLWLWKSEEEEQTVTKFVQKLSNISVFQRTSSENQSTNFLQDVARTSLLYLQGLGSLMHQGYHTLVDLIVSPVIRTLREATSTFVTSVCNTFLSISSYLSDNILALASSLRHGVHSLFAYIVHLCSVISSAIYQSLVGLLYLLKDFSSDLLVAFKNIFSIVVQNISECICFIYDMSVHSFLRIFKFIADMFSLSSLKVYFSYLFTKNVDATSDFESTIDSYQHVSPVTEIPHQELFEQHKTVSKLAIDLHRFGDRVATLTEYIPRLKEDISLMKEKVEVLESELTKEKEKRADDLMTMISKFENGVDALQKYQLEMRHVLRRCCSRSNMLLHAHSHKQMEDFINNFKKWTSSNFLTKDKENAIVESVSKESEKSSLHVHKLEEEFVSFVNEFQNQLNSLKVNISRMKIENNSTLSVPADDEYVKKIVNNAFKIYEADKTGRTDYALESSGGQIRSIKCTEPYIETPMVYSFLGIPLYTVIPTPSEAIKPGMSPGECWAFVGSRGHMVIELSHIVYVTGFTVEHISRLISPNGKIESAPKDFNMLGLQTENDPEPVLFGEFTYEDNGETLQYFPVQNHSPVPFKLVELTVLSNHGHPDYTCLYRIRVHGRLAKD